MEKYVFLNLWTIRAIGVWHPETSSAIKLKIYGFMRSLTVMSVLFIIMPAVIAAGEHLRNYNISKGVELLALLISAILVLCKILNIVLRRNRIRSLLDEMSEFWRGARSNEVRAMKGFAEVGRNVTKWYLILGFFSIISFIGQPFLNTFIYGVENSSTVLVNRMPFDGWENFVVHYSKSPIIFAIVYTSHAVAGILASGASIGHDCLFVVLILHVCANLKAVASSLKELKSFNEEEIEERIIRCGIKFQNLIEYTKELENMLSVYLLAQSISSTFIICLTTFLVSRDLNANKEFFKYVSFWFAALFQLFIFCWAANYLQTETQTRSSASKVIIIFTIIHLRTSYYNTDNYSTHIFRKYIMTNRVGESAYDAYGELMNMSIKNHLRHRHLLTKIPRYLQLILLRSQKPLEITAGNFYTVSLENYKNILSTSYSYFTILRAFADTKN